MLGEVPHTIPGTREAPRSTVSLNTLFHQQRFLSAAALPSTAFYTMLPPVEEAVLQNNPEFAALYSTLTTAVLNPDGTTKDDKSNIARQRDAVREVHSIQTRLSSVVFCCN